MSAQCWIAMWIDGPRRHVLAECALLVFVQSYADGPRRVRHVQSLYVDEPRREHHAPSYSVLYVDGTHRDQWSTITFSDVR